MLHRTEINSSYPIVGRTIGRSIIGSLNFSLVNIASLLIRQEQRGTLNLNQPLEEVVDDADANIAKNGIDDYNDQQAKLEEDNEERRTREEQGLVVPIDNRVLAGMMLRIRQHIDRGLRDKAARLESVLDPGKTFLDPWHIGESLLSTVDRQLQRVVPTELTSRVKAELEALRQIGVAVSEERAKTAMTVRFTRQVTFLKENKQLILDMIESFGSDCPSDLEAQGVWDKLPAINQLRLMVAADTGLYYAAEREAISWAESGRQIGKTNAALLSGARRDIHKDIAEFEKQARIKRELDTAYERGARQPTMMPLPDPVPAKTKKVA